MRKLAILLFAALLVAPVCGLKAQNNAPKGKKVESPFIEGRQKVRKADYDSIFKFTTFDGKKKYFCDFDYTKIRWIMEEGDDDDWGNFRPVLNYLKKNPRAPIRMCFVYAINPTVTDPALKATLRTQGDSDCCQAMRNFQEWAEYEGMLNKFQYNIGQIDYRYWQGTDYFYNEQPKDELVHVGLILYMGTKKVVLFPNAAADARTFKDVKFFPNDATVQPSYNPLIDTIATYLKQNERYELLLLGYTDNQGTAAYSKGLARQRATEIKKLLVMRGVPEYRIEIEAVGSDDPIGDNNTYEGRIANNRVAIKIQ